MTWFKVDDDLHGHPKARKAGLAAMGMWVLAGSYSSRYLTEGFVPEWWVLAVPQGKKRALELVLAGFWDVEIRGDEKGWVFHDWDKFQPSKVEVLADREASRERQRIWRQRRRDAVSNGVTDGVTNGSPSRPVPSRPKKEDKDLSIDSTFNQFWAVYPRRVAKPKARAAFEKALKRTLFATILAGAERFRDDPNREDQFTPYPASWLNADGWLDPPLPAKRQTVQDKRDIPTPFAPRVDKAAEEARKAAAVPPPVEALASLRKRLAGAISDFDVENESLGGCEDSEGLEDAQ